MNNITMGWIFTALAIIGTIIYHTEWIEKKPIKSGLLLGIIAVTIRAYHYLFIM